MLLKSRKVYYKIGEVAEMFEVNTSLIRYWEQEFDIIKPKKSKGGVRLFTLKDIDQFEIIFHLVKEKGMTVQGARDFIKNKQDQNDFEKLEVINTLKRTKSFLVDIKNILDERAEDDL